MGKNIGKVTVCFIGFLALLFISFQTAGIAGQTKITLNDNEVTDKTQSISQAKAEYLAIQKQDQASLKSFLATADRGTYAIISTSDPRIALKHLKEPNHNAKKLAGSVLVPVNSESAGTGIASQTFKTIYQVYLIME